MDLVSCFVVVGPHHHIDLLVRNFRFGETLPDLRKTFVVVRFVTLANLVLVVTEMLDLFALVFYLCEAECGG
jgi:hypothetical protein